MSAETYDRSKEEVYEQEIMEKIESAAYEKILKFGTLIDTLLSLILSTIATIYLSNVQLKKRTKTITA